MIAKIKINEITCMVITTKKWDFTISNILWWIWFLSAINGERLLYIRIIKTRSKSIKGYIIIMIDNKALFIIKEAFGL